MSTPRFLIDADENPLLVYMCHGRLERMVSIAAALTTMSFKRHYPGDIDAHFDCAPYAVPKALDVSFCFASR